MQQEQREQGVAVFWDFETARVKSLVSGYQVAKGLRDVANAFGLVKSIRAYMDVTNQSHPKFPSLRRELHASGITIVDCPTLSRKDVADKAMIVDMLTLAMDETSPRTIIVATGDPDLSYALAVLRLRRFKIVLVCPSDAHESLLMQADDNVNWNSQVLGLDGDNDSSGSSSSTSSSSSSSTSDSSALSYVTPLPPNHGIRRSTKPRTGPAKAQTPRSPTPVSRQTTGSESRALRAEKGWPIWEHGDDVNETDTLSAASSLNSPRITTVKGLSNEGPAVPVNGLAEGNASTHSVGPTLGAEHTTTNPRSRARAGTLPSTYHFPPALPRPQEETPAAPVEAPIQMKLESTTKTSVPSPQSSGGFSIVDHPSTYELQTKDRTPSPTSAGSHITSTPPPAVTHDGSAPANPSPPTPPAVVTDSFQTVLSSMPATPRPTNEASHPTETTSANGTAAMPTATVGLSASTPVLPADPLPATTKAISPIAAPADPVMPPKATVRGATTSIPVSVTPAVPKTSPGITRPTLAPSPSILSGANRPLSESANRSSAEPNPSKLVPERYRVLVRRLQYHRKNGEPWPNQSIIAGEIIKGNPNFYKSIGLKKWGTYASNAAEAGIVKLKGTWISLTEEWVDAVVP